MELNGSSLTDMTVQLVKSIVTMMTSNFTHVLARLIMANPGIFIDLMWKVA